MVNRRQTIAAVGSLALSAGMPLHAETKPLRLLVGFPAGGATDVVARALGNAIQGKTGVPVIVENRSGAGGRIALEYAKAAEPDGSLAVITPNDMVVIYPHVYKKLSYDPVNDFKPVAQLISYPFIISVGPKVPASVRTVNELMKWFEANPKEAFYSTPAPGSTPHFVGTQLAKASGVHLTHTAYRGDAPAIQDVLGGAVAMNIAVPTAILPQLSGGKIRVLATTGQRRLPQLPDVPTLSEAGIPVVANGWYGAFVPRATPDSAVRRLEAWFQDALKHPDVAEGVTKLQLTSSFLRGADTAKRIREDIDRWGPIVRDSGFKPED